MSRFGTMTDSDTSTKIGVGETLAVVSLGIQLRELFPELVKVLGNIILAFAGKNNTDRKIIVKALSLELDKIIETFNSLQLPMRDETIIQSYVELMMTTAKQLEERLHHPKFLQVWDVVKNGTFEKHIAILRNGLTDISRTLGPYQQGSSHHQTVSPYQVGSSMVQQHPHMSASTPAPPQVVYNHYESHTYNLNTGMRGSNDYVDVAPGLDQAHPHGHGSNPRIGYHQPIPAYPPASHR